MRKSFLKNLFKKRKYDWDSEEYRKISISLLEETAQFNFYQDESQNKKEFQERLRKLED